MKEIITAGTPAPIWAAAVTFQAARRFWSDTEEVRWWMKEEGRYLLTGLGYVAEDIGYGIADMSIALWWKVEERIPMAKRTFLSLAEDLSGTLSFWARKTATGMGRSSIGLATGMGRSALGWLLVLALLLSSILINEGRKARARLAASWRFREELIAEWA